ncbi:HEAT repeat domain-containing protein, partial [uncultured Nostoc sp.]|uniref:HEAT repeat domain-containing protein n=1 Tax=uncultured Nostoc sp. TaxID=340711 RepID=UPI0034583968
MSHKSANILNDEKEYLYVRCTAAWALGNLGHAASKYIPDIANILKDEKVDSSVRSGAAVALCNFGQAAVKYIPDI